MPGELEQIPQNQAEWRLEATPQSESAMGVIDIEAHARRVAEVDRQQLSAARRKIDDLGRSSAERHLSGAKEVVARFDNLPADELQKLDNDFYERTEALQMLIGELKKQQQSLKETPKFLGGLVRRISDTFTRSGDESAARFKELTEKAGVPWGTLEEMLRQAKNSLTAIANTGDIIATLLHKRGFQSRFEQEVAQIKQAAGKHNPIERGGLSELGEGEIDRAVEGIGRLHN